jgi:hypothetical protein
MRYEPCPSIVYCALQQVQAKGPVSIKKRRECPGTTQKEAGAFYSDSHKNQSNDEKRLWDKNYDLFPAMKIEGTDKVTQRVSNVKKQVKSGNRRDKKAPMPFNKM